MKLKTTETIKAQTLKFTPAVTLSHGQTIRQTENYQSMEAHFSMSIQVDDTKEAIEEGWARLKSEVGFEVVKKARQQKAALKAMTGGNQ